MGTLASGLSWAALVAGAAAVASSAACVKHDTETQITVTIASEARVPQELSAIQVTVFGADGSLRYDRVYEVVASTFFPTTLAVIPSTEDSLRAPVTVEVRGVLAGSELLLRRAVVSFVEGRSLYLPMPLRMACFQQTHCNATESCVGGTCRSATVDTSVLADYADRLVFDSAPGASCFREDTCLAGAGKVTVSADCTFPLPGGASPGGGAKPDVNVAIEWDAAPGRIITLDEGDAVEGWTIDGANGRLSPGVCQALAEQADSGRPIPDKAVAAWVSTACAPKSGLQPYCRASDGSVGVGRANP